jgi:AraC family transcriptional regulator, exoenzyme S synthesis regulatory protein ExsA
MQAIRFTFGQLSGSVTASGSIHAVSTNCIVITRDDSTICDAGADTDLQSMDFYAADFRKLYGALAGLIAPAPQGPFWMEPIRIVQATPEVIRMLELLAPVSRESLLSFLYVYCLGTDRRYFSSLLHTAMTASADFIDFIDMNALKHWSVSRFADEFGISLRKFNLLFIDNYGTSAKHWLLGKRLSHARHLLASTSMRILDVAQECGFINHAHFTESFRKHFLCTPIQFRLNPNQAYEVRNTGNPRWTSKLSINNYPG